MLLLALKLMSSQLVPTKKKLAVKKWQFKFFHTAATKFFTIVSPILTAAI